MIKLVYCLRRKPDVPAAEFHRYWLDEHGPLVKEVSGAIRAVRYVQSHTVEPEINALLQQSRGLAPAFDGITEVWWKDVSELQAALTSAEGQAALQRLLEDEARFIDFARSHVFMTREQPIF